MDYNMKLANQVCFSAYNVSRLFAQFYEKELKSFGLTYSQYLVLLSLWEEILKHYIQLVINWNLSSNTLTPLLKRLEQSGWVTRQKSDQDKRQLIVSLTQKGKDQKQPIYDAISRCVSEDMNLDLYKQTKDIMDQLEATLRKQLNK
uniref:HTH-type transcriptional regulator SarZ n=1 Tax=Mammaliicoccus sciuri TaxID=1296 RepID=O05984_MAMSC|nr:MarR family transcriptional regulator homologue [Mammaliicoccus sciuri]CAA70426.1 hypothetical protein [Mammaliicoccus sciuri]